MILNKYFDNIYIPYINNNELLNIKWKLEELSIKVTFFKGYDGSLFKEYNTFIKKQQEKKQKDSSIINLTRGQYGHITTFINIFKDAIKNNFNKILILEPDVYFSKNIQNIWKQYCELNYKILYLGASQNYYYKEQTWENINPVGNYYNAYKTLGTFAIAFDSSIFNNVLDTISKYNVPTDIALFELQNKYNNIYVCYPNIICCNVVCSTTSGLRSNKIIQTDRIIQCKWTLDYDFKERIILCNNNNKKIKITLYINSILPNNEIIVNCNHNIEINYNYYVVYITPNNNTVIIMLYNIFIDSYNIIYL
jgi:GR25 family glycosyltransferase involved in LPS biosynthesis